MVRDQEVGGSNPLAPTIVFFVTYDVRLVCAHPQTSGPAPPKNIFRQLSGWFPAIELHDGRVTFEVNVAKMYD